MIVHRYINKYHVTQAPTSATTAPPPHPSRPRTLYCTFCATHEAICSALASLLQPHPPSFSVSRPDLTSRLQVGLSQHWHCPRPSTVVATWLRNSAFKEQLSGQKADDATGSRSSAPMNHTPAAGAQGLSLIGRSMACGHRDKSDAACMRRAAPPTPKNVVTARAPAHRGHPILHTLKVRINTFTKAPPRAPVFWGMPWDISMASRRRRMAHVGGLAWEGGGRRAGGAGPCEPRFRTPPSSHSRAQMSGAQRGSGGGSGVPPRTYPKTIPATCWSCWGRGAFLHSTQ